MAQSACSQKEKSTADAASELLVDPNATDKSAISDSLAQPVAEDPGSLSVPAKTLDVMTVPDANPISLVNCSGKKAIIKTYNSNDSVLLIPFETKTIEDGAAASLKCKTKSCKLRVGTGSPTGALSGYLKLTNRISESSKPALQQEGC